MNSNNFDRVAKWYDGLARMVFGGQIREAQTFYLSELPQQGKILVIGGGTGWILREILALRPNLGIDYVEASNKMLTLSQTKADNTQIRFIHGTETDIPATRYDALVTNFFLDVFDENRLKSVMSILKDHIAKDGVWLCADFQKTDKTYHRILLRLMHQFFRSASRLESTALKDFHPYFTQNYLKMVRDKNFYGGMIFSRIYKPI